MAIKIVNVKITSLTTTVSQPIFIQVDVVESNWVAVKQAFSSWQAIKDAFSNWAGLKNW